MDACHLKGEQTVDISCELTHVSIARIPLTRGAVALVDDADYDRVCQFSWYLMDRGATRYAATAYTEKSKKIHLLMHRYLLNAPKGVMVAHVNGDGLDNQRENLRLGGAITRRGDRGTSRFRGVSWHDGKGSWRAELFSRGQKHFLGWFSREEEAAQAYDTAVRLYRGSEEGCNFPEDSPRTRT